MIKEIAEFIEGFSGCDWELGVNLFVGFLPEKDKNGNEVGDQVAVILEASGGQAVGELPDWKDPLIIRIRNRARDYHDGREDAYCIFDSIHGTAGWRLPVVDGPEYKALVIDAANLPYPIENPSNSGFFIWQTDYKISITSAE